MNIIKNIILSEKSLSDRIIDAFLAFAMSFCIAYEFITILQFSYAAYVVLFIVLIMTAIAFFSTYNKKTIFVSLVAYISCIVLISLGCLFITSFRENIFNFFYWLYGYILGITNFNAFYEFSAVVFFCFVVSFIVYFLVTNRLWFIPLIAGAILFVVSTQQMLPLNYFSFYVFDITALLFYFQYVYQYNKKKAVNKIIKQRSIALWAIPLCLIAFIISYNLPSSQYPIQFKWLDDKINSFGEKYGVMSFDHFDINLVGFGNNSLLGGDCSPNSMKALVVKASKPIYLKGNILDNYTGSSWINTENVTSSLIASSSEHTLQNYEMQEGMNFLPQIQINKNQPIFPSNINKSTYIDYDNIQVTYKQISTKTLFVASGFTNMSIPKQHTIINKNSTVQTQKSNSKNFTYQLNTYNYKYGDETFQDILRTSKKGLYAINTNSYNNTVRGILKSRADSIYAKYLQLPSTLPIRVSTLAKSITAKSTNNYDKVKMIEKYLATKMEYTLTPPTNSKSQDFVDFFLFDSQKGYCTYYATAMTVLVRSLGIPARYVEGYLMPSEKDKASGLYIVTNKTAHAWVEVYFEGIGWIQFEPTSTYNQSFYSNSLIKIVDANSGPQQAISKASLSSPILQNYIPNPYEITQPNSRQKTSKTSIPSVLIFIIVFLIIIISPILINDMRVKIRLKRAFNIAPRQSILALYQYYLQLFALIGLQISPNETATEYAKRISVSHDIFKELDFEGITQIFVITKYSEHTMTEDDKIKLTQFYQSLFMYFKSNCNGVKYFVYHYLFGNI